MRKIFFLIIIAIIIIASCTKSSQQRVGPSADRLQSILLSDTLNMYTGQTRQLPITLMPVNYHLDSIKWQSSDTSVITISNSGLLTAKKAGTATISVSNLSNTVKASTLITVSATPTKDRLKSIALSDTLNMYVGQTRTLPVTLTPSDYHLDSLKFKSSDTTITTISAVAVVKAKKIGTSTISVSNLTNTISVSTLVTVVAAPPVDSLKFGLVAYYPFNNSAADLSGNGNNGMATNVLPTTDRFGNNNAAYYFNSSEGADSSWVVVKDNASLRLSGTDFTINTWVKPTQYNSNYGAIIIDKRGHVSNSCWIVGMSGKYAYYPGISQAGMPYLASTDATGYPVLATTSPLDTTKWHMVTTIYIVSTRTASIYIDGVLNNSVSNMPAPAATNNADIYIGKDNPVDFGGYFFQGKINDIRIYNRAISIAQIINLYNAPN